MATANGDRDYTEEELATRDRLRRRTTILPWWLYLLLGFLIVGLIRFLDWIHQ